MRRATPESDVPTTPELGAVRPLKANGHAALRCADARRAPRSEGRCFVSWYLGITPSAGTKGGVLGRPASPTTAPVSAKVIAPRSKRSELDAEAAFGAVLRKVTPARRCGSAECFETAGDVDDAAPFAVLDPVDG